MTDAMAEEYNALLEQVANEEAMREAAENMAATAQTELAAAQVSHPRLGLHNRHLIVTHYSPHSHLILTLSGDAGVGEGR